MKLKCRIFVLVAIFLALWSMEFATRIVTFPEKLTSICRLLNSVGKIRGVSEVESTKPSENVTESYQDIIAKSRDVRKVKSRKGTGTITPSDQDKCDQLQDIHDEQIFQPADANNKVYVFSALWDNVDQAKQKIRIVGMLDGSQRQFSMWYCYIRDKDSKKCIRVEAAEEKHLYDQWDWFSGRLFLCELPADIVPEGVSLMTVENGPMLNKLSVIRDGGNDQLRYNFTMCVARFHSGYNNSLQLITMIELDMILGADFFVFYNYSMSESIGLIVLKLVEEGSAMLVQWQLPDGHVAAYGHNSMINDCMNRMMYRTRFISETDFDEFIIPKKHKNWQNLIEEKQKEYPQVGVFLAQTEYYLSESANYSFKFPGRESAEKYNVSPLLNLERRTDIPRALRLSKYIYDPRKVENLWVHTASRLREPWISVLFRDYEAEHHHYRKYFEFEYKLKASRPKTFKTDTRMFRYKDELLRRVKTRVDDLEKYYGIALL